MKSRRIRGVFSGVGMACLLSVLAISLLNSIELKRKSQARDAAHTFALKLVESLNQAVAGVYMLSAAVDRNSGEVVRFHELAEELVGSFPLIRTFELAPKGVIRHVHPVRGNELIVGHDLLVDKTRNREVHLAISKRQMGIAGPLQLRQGGVGLLARYPLYLTSTDGRSHFWGLSIGVIDLPSLLLQSGESEFSRLGYRYEICWRPLAENECKGISGATVTPEKNDIVVKIGLPQAEWNLLVNRPGGWLSGAEMILALLAVLLPSFGAAYWLNRQGCR